MAKIIKTEVVEVPKMKFIGKRYTEKDRNAYGLFSDKWGEWFEKGYFNLLQGEDKGLETISDDYIGLCHCTGNAFEYYIGVFMAPTDVAPEGFVEVNFEAGKIFVCYIYGSDEKGDIYSHEITNECFKLLKEQGHVADEHCWDYERYNCPRFTKPDAEGKVILDYCIYIKE